MKRNYNIYTIHAERDLLPSLCSQPALRILMVLMQQPATMIELQYALDQTDRSLRKHLERLERAGLVKRWCVPNARGPRYRYELIPQTIRIDIETDAKKRVKTSQNVSPEHEEAD